MTVRLSMLLNFIIGSCILFAQSPGHKDDTAYDLKIPVDLVVVPVTVEDKEGELIHSLKKDDFEIFEDGVPQRITYFSIDPSPLSVAFLIDRTVDERTQRIFRENMLALVEAFSSFDEMAFYEYLESVKKLHDFTYEKEDLLKSISKVDFEPLLLPWASPLAFAPVVNTSSLDNAIRTAADDLQRRGRNRRKVIFVVSNGVTSARDRGSYLETRKYLLQNSIVVYGIGQGNSLVFRKVDPLKRYTGPTGGEAFYPWKTKAFSETYQKISEAARNQYVLGYSPQNEQKDGTYRNISVRVTRNGFAGKVRYRKGYFAGRSLGLPQ